MFKRIFSAKPEPGLFSQILTFSIVGLSISFALAFTVDLQIAAQWI